MNNNIQKDKIFNQIPKVSPEQIKFYEENGYLVLDSVLNEECIQTLKNQGQKLIKDFVDSAAKEEELTTFSTKKQSTNSYFLDSADKISFFWEPTAFDETQKLRADINKYNAINKIGHNLHELDPIFSSFSLHSVWKEICNSIGLQDPIIAQSMYIVKSPKLGGEVVAHQDSTFVNTKPLSCIAFWFPLENVTTENACLWVAPKSHKFGIASRFRLTEDKKDTLMTKADPNEQAPWADHNDCEFSKKQFPEKWIPLECKKGALVILHGSLLHLSEHNTSQKPRDVMSFHVVDKKCQFSQDNWIQKKNWTSFL